MRLAYRIKQVPDLLRALRAGRELIAHDDWSPQRLADHQQAALRAIVHHAATRSPFYRELYAGLDLDGPIDLETLPTIDKATLMERFDDVVTDPALRLARLEAHLDGLARDELYRGTYRAMVTGGTTGRRGVFVFSRADWRTGMAQSARWFDAVGIAPRVPRRRRLAMVGAVSALHMTARFGMSMDMGAHRILRVDARRPVRDQVGPLSAFGPDAILGYPSALALLAIEQIEGRLDLAPEMVSTTSEVRTEDMRRLIVEAWDREPYDCYGITEGGIVGTDCREHAGLHLAEDLVIMEVVDAAGRAVRDGEVGDRVLVTNLFKRTQPIIRYELSDLLRVTSEPCPCGRPYRRALAVEGRSDDVLHLPGRDGRTVAVPPIAVRSPLAGFAGVRQYRVVHDDEGLHVDAALRTGVAIDATVHDVRAALQRGLSELGADGVDVDVRVVDALARDPGPANKFKLVESRVER